MTEDTLLSYLKSPEDYIKTTAEQYMRDNQEEFLAQFLKKDALLAEYQMLSQDSDAPVYRMRAITDALQKSGAKTVNVTVQKDGVELTFKTSAESLKGLKSQYSTWYIAPSDRLQFRHLFGAGSDYSAEDIIRIAYGRSTLYRKAVTQVGTAWGLPIPDTQRWLDLIRQEEIAVTQAAEPEKVNHVMEEKDLPINASGLQTLDNIWGLFETAVKLNSADGRREMYALARELSECQNLTDWIIKSQTENEGAQVSMACTQN